MSPQQPPADAVPGDPRRIRVEGGLATLGPDALALRNALDERFSGWGRLCDAHPTAYPTLVDVRKLSRIDYFKNFPHLATLAAGLDQAAMENYAAGGDVTSLPAAHLADAAYALPSAACYSVYLDLDGQVLPEPHYVTTVANCFRREDHFDGLRRLLGFTMREIVCVGEREAVLGHIARYQQLIGDYLAEIELPVEVAIASDPFFDPDASRALMQQLFPVKREFVYGGSLAIASVNYHRNFFGERCRISLPSGEPAFSGCVAFGLERWLAALTDHFTDLDLAGITAHLAGLGERVALEGARR
jgi:seryl-tRNA synthetase